MSIRGPAECAICAGSCPPGQGAFRPERDLARLLREGTMSIAPLPKKALVRDLVTEIAPPDERLHGKP